MEAGSRSNVARIVSHHSSGQHGDIHQERHHAASGSIESVRSTGMNVTPLMHRSLNGQRSRTELVVLDFYFYSVRSLII